MYFGPVIVTLASNVLSMYHTVSYIDHLQGRVWIGRGAGARHTLASKKTQVNHSLNIMIAEVWAKLPQPIPAHAPADYLYFCFINETHTNLVPALFVVVPLRVAISMLFVKPCPYKQQCAHYVCASVIILVTAIFLPMYSL